MRNERYANVLVSAEELEAAKFDAVKVAADECMKKLRDFGGIGTAGIIVEIRTGDRESHEVDAATSQAR